MGLDLYHRQSLDLANNGGVASPEIQVLCRSRWTTSCQIQPVTLFMRAGRVLMKVCGGAWSKRWDGGAGKGLNLLHDYLYIPVLSCVIYLLSNLFIYVYAVPGRNRICQVKFV